MMAGLGTRRVGLVLLGLLLVVAPHLATDASAQRYVVTDLGTLGGHASDAFESVPHKINESGQVAGRAMTAEGKLHPFLFRDGQMIDLGTLGGDSGEAYGINDAGTVVGLAATGAGYVHAFRYQGGVLSDLGTPGGTYSTAFSINNHGVAVGYGTRSDGKGQVSIFDGSSIIAVPTLGGQAGDGYGINDHGVAVGFSYLPGNTRQHAFKYDGVSIVDLGTLGGAHSVAWHVNAVGQITGWSGTADGRKAPFLYTEGRMIELGGFGGREGEALGLNDFGHVVGGATDGGARWRAFLYKDGEFIDLNTLVSPDSGWFIQSAHDINNAGEIAAVCEAEGHRHACLLTPLPVVSILPDANAAEPNEPGAFTVTRTGPTDTPLVVHIQTSGTASNGVDYVQLPETITIPVGDHSQAVPVLPIDDDLKEPTEDVHVVITPSDAYTVGTVDNATIVIADNEPTVTVLAVDTDASEMGPDTGEFSIARDGDLSSDLIVGVVVTGTAINGLDYETIPSSVSIPTGAAAASVQVIPIRDRVRREDPETVVLTLAPAPSYGIGMPNSATVAISEKSTPPAEVPDLVIVALDAPKVVLAGSATAVAIATGNIGNSVAGPSVTQLWLSTDSLLDSNDILMASVDVPPLAANDVNSSTVTLALPATMSKTKAFLIAVADGTGVVVEEVESNNQRTESVRIQ